MSTFSLVGGSTPAERHIGGTTTGVLVATVRELVGDDGVLEVLRVAGDDRPVEAIADTAAWSTYDQSIALFLAAAEVTGLDAIGRHVGENLLRQYAGTEVAAVLRSLGSPGEVLRNIATAASKYSTVTAMRAVEVGEGEATVEAVTQPPITRHRVFCDYTVGVLSQAAPLFGLETVEVAELQCQTRGDDRCLYRVVWADEADAERQVAHLHEQLAALTARFESLQATAVELVSAQTVEEVLDAVAERAGLAVRAPRFLLAVRIGPGEGALHLRHVGFDDEASAAALADRLLADDSVHDAGALVVPVATRRQRFGILTAMAGPDQGFFPQERQLLATYAAYAAAALESATALDEARRQTETAQALRDVASSLADVTTRDELTAAVMESSKRVAGAEAVSVMLWHEELGGLRMTAMDGFGDGTQELLGDLVIRPSDTPALQEMLDAPAPVFVDERSEEPFLKGLLALADVQAATIVPIAARGKLLGILAVCFRDDATRPHDLTTRLAGIAHSAASAVLTVQLLEERAHQADHDPLTGLANARTLGRYAESRPVARRTAALFVDLDRFKPINDALGHAAGDEVLQEVARRLASVTRPSDLVARLGGDEFVVLLDDVATEDDARCARDRVAEAVCGPFTVAGVTVHLHASIGLALAGPDGAAVADLVREADERMYEAKQLRA